MFTLGALRVAATADYMFFKQFYNTDFGILFYDW